VSASDPNSESADKPAELAPDEPTAVHDVPESVPARAAGELRAEQELAVEQELASPAAPHTPAPVASEPPSAPVVAAPPVVPDPPVAPDRVPAPAFVPDAGSAQASDAPPPVTSSGLPNPHGLPEIAVERPEVAIGAAFAGGLAFATILKRLAR
jgi:hypothetical protein